MAGRCTPLSSVVPRGHAFCSSTIMGSLEEMVRFKTAVMIAGAVSAALIVGMFVFQYVVFQCVQVWIRSGTELSTFQRMLITMAAFWSKFWILGIQLIALTVFLLVGVVFVLMKALRPRNRQWPPSLTNC